MGDKKIEIKKRYASGVIFFKEKIWNAEIFTLTILLIPSMRDLINLQLLIDNNNIQEEIIITNISIWFEM